MTSLASIGDCSPMSCNDSENEAYFKFMEVNWRSILANQHKSLTGEEAQLLVWQSFMKINNNDVKKNMNVNRGQNSKSKIVSSFDLKNPYLENVSSGGERKWSNTGKCELFLNNTVPSCGQKPLKPKFIVPVKLQLETSKEVAVQR